MQSTPLSRTNSPAASGRTLIGSDNGAYSPWEGGISSPIIQTPDQKQWIDLELLNPRFLKGLSQYAPSVKDESDSKLGKGAAKLKAWVRQSKTGIDIRLRRKINNEKEITTEIQLAPATSPWPYARDKCPPMQELPAMRSVAELPDTGTRPATELDATQSDQPSRSSTGSTIHEPLPRYEREPGLGPAGIISPVIHPQDPAMTNFGAEASGVGREVSPIRPSEITHRPSVSQSSIVATPTRGLSLRDAPSSSPQADGEKDDSDQYATLLKADLEDAKLKLEEERQWSESLQAIIQALNDDQSSSPQRPVEASAATMAGSSSEAAQRNRLTVVSQRTYETETEREDLLSPKSNRKPPGSTRRKKSVTFPRQRPGWPPTGDGVHGSDSEEGGLDVAAGTLIRKQTLPKRVPAGAGIEVLWRSLIRMQTILLGPDHRLTVRSKSDLRTTRTGKFSASVVDLNALEQSRDVANRDFGPDHPWAAAFAEDLEKLTGLFQRQMLRERDQGPKSVMSDASVIPSSTEFSTKAKGIASSPPELTITGDTDTAPPAANTLLHKIDTSVQDPSCEKEPSPVVGGVEIDSRLDVVWNAGGSPHQPQGNHIVFARLGFAALSRVAWGGIDWLQRNYGPERPVEAGKTRVRWTCSCGERLHDDFIEKRPGAARALEAYLNRPKGGGLAPQNTYVQKGSSPTTAGSSPGNQSFGSSFGAPPSSQTSFSNGSFPNASWSNGNESKMQHTWSSMPSQLPFSPTYEPPWLLTCAMEDRFTPKVTHLDMSRHKIHSDKDLANSLREHYFNVNKKWYKGLRLRGLSTIEFVQFEVHQNRFADIRSK